jgi:hypothetical protein
MKRFRPVARLASSAICLFILILWIGGRVFAMPTSVQHDNRRWGTYVVGVTDGIVGVGHEKRIEKPYSPKQAPVGVTLWHPRSKIGAEGFGFGLIRGIWTNGSTDYYLWAIYVPCWFAAALLGLPGARWVAGWARRGRRMRRGECVECGYDLRASGERCPECGEGVVQCGRETNRKLAL